MCAASNDELRVRLSQYEKTVDLYVHEDRVAWDLVSIYMVVQVGLISAVAALFVAFKSYLGTFRFVFLFLAGFFYSFLWFFAFWRSLMWRQNWYLAGLRIERELVERRLIRDSSLISFGTFEIMRRSSKKVKWALELSDDKTWIFATSRIENRDGVRELELWKSYIGVCSPLLLFGLSYP
jgi:hypothetical protein